MASHTSDKLLNCMWKLTLPLKVKVFSWLLICEMLKTRQRLHSFSPNVPFVCIFCNHHEESLYHLFMIYSFSQNLWRLTGLFVSPLHWLHSFVLWLDSLRYSQIRRNCFKKKLCFAINFGELVTSLFSTMPQLQLSTLLFMLLQSRFICTTRLILLLQLFGSCTPSTSNGTLLQH